MSQKLYKKRVRLNYKQYKQHLQATGDTDLQNVIVEDQWPTVADILAIKIGKYSTLAKHNCGYSRTAEDLIFNHVCPLYLKDRAIAIKENNNNWREATTGPFTKKYRKAMKTNIKFLNFIGAW